MKHAFSLLLLLGFLSVPVTLAARSPVAIGRSVPAFTLPDTTGQGRSLAEFRGRPVAVFFFCGCVPCHDFARLWAQAQQNGDLGTGKLEVGKQVSTAIVFAGERRAALSFAEETRLDLTRTLVLLDPADEISQRFNVQQCPRVFVLDPMGHLTYSNFEAKLPAYSNFEAKLPAPVLISRVLTAWRSLSSVSGTAQKRKRP